MSSRKVTPDNLGEVINEILTDYADTVVADAKEAVEETGKMAVKTAQAYASRIGRGKYAKSIKCKTTEAGRVSTTVTIYSTQYRIAHLLEHGHTIVDKNGEPRGTTRAFHHFSPAEEMAETTLERKIQQAIKGA